MKKLLSAVLAVVLILSLAPVAVATKDDDDVAYPVEGGNIYIDEATKTVTGADSWITAAVIPDGVVSIGDYAFDGCDSMTSVIIPDGVTSIGCDAFFDCAALTKIDIPNSVTNVGSNAFEWCSGLTSVVIPDSVTSIELGAFDHCFMLNEITVSNGNSSYMSKDGVLLTSDGKALHTYPAGKTDETYIIPDGVSNIGSSAFLNCDNLTSVVIPSSVVSIEENAFEDCSGLTSVIIPDGVTSVEYKTFGNCHSLATVVIPSSVTSIGDIAFFGCTSLTSVVIPDSVTSIGESAFDYCPSLTSVVIPDSVTSIGSCAFESCSSLTSVVIPSSVTSIGPNAFAGCYTLTDIYFGGTEEQWIANGGSQSYFASSIITVHYNSTGPEDTTIAPTEHVYDTTDPGAGVADLVEGAADEVTSESDAVEAVKAVTGKMSAEQKASATGADLATLLAETAAAKAASKAVAGKEIIINKANVEPLAEKAGSAVDAVDAALVSGGVTTARYLSNTVILTSAETGEITIKIDPDILETEVDKVRVETPNYALTLKMSDLKEDLTQQITIKASSVAATEQMSVHNGANMRPMAPASQIAAQSAVRIELPNGKLSGPAIISFPDGDGDDNGDETIVDSGNNAKSSKYNPATSTLDGKVTESGTYTTTTNSKDFTDISGKSKEMQQAIRYLASKGIINGTSETTFSPDGAISRAEIAALLVRALGKMDNSAKSGFADVRTSDWFYATAASSEKCGLIKGYEDNTFRGNNQILKQETVTVVSRVLQNEMNYKLPATPATYLTRYSDTIPDWVKSDLALVTRENLLVYRVDGTFSGSKTFTRGDAAIVLYRLFQKIW